MKIHLLTLIAGTVISVSAATDTIRVGTYNIRYLARADMGTENSWDERRADMVGLIRKLDLDVFGMQEVCPEQVAYIRDRMSDYELVGDHRNADRKTGDATPVCYRKSRFSVIDSGTFWLSETPDVPGSKSWGTACPRICTYLVLKDKGNAKTFCFANTHLDHISALARENGVLLILRRMKDFAKGAPIVLTGDHNGSESAKPALLISKVLKDALYESKTPPRGPWRTLDLWQWRETEISIAEALTYPSEVRNAPWQSKDQKRVGTRCDYIYVSPGVKVMDFRSAGDSRPGKKLYPSDHFPVVATIEFP